ncbi:MAG: transglutaminase-like domain-containing protein [Armatimonadota bacterium]|nr:transglutaminase-like domain-containing protein [Armatimonadota bacterium]
MSFTRSQLFMRKWILLAMLVAIPARSYAYKVPYEAWMGAYVGENKVGYLCLKIERSELDGVRVYRIASTMHTRLTVLGVELIQDVTTIVLADESWRPLYEEFVMSSGGKTTTVTARFGKSSIDCVVTSGQSASKKSVAVPEGANLVGDSMFATLDKVPGIGSEYRAHYFNPLTLAVEEIIIKAERQEELELGGRLYSATVLSNHTPMGDMTVWQARDGEVLKVAAMMGISLIREPAEQAKAGLAGTTEDFAFRTRAKTDKPIQAPRECKALDVLLYGLSDSSMVISDSRQKVDVVDEKKGVYRYRIRAELFDVRKSVMLPVRKLGFDNYLVPTPYVDCDAPSIKTHAESIVGTTKKAYTACSKIRQWIYSKLKVKADVGITRSASDVLESKSGVCRDYAVLFAALARAVGVPTKVVSGLVYLNDGFYYHAWVECWVGQWVPFDATMPTDFVDATHIKLAEGDATTMFTLAKVIGNLRAEVK